MKQEAQRAAISETCGWIKDHINRSAMFYVPRLDARVGDPLNDLNACHEMEKALPLENVCSYMFKLSWVMRCPPAEKGQLHTFLFHATAAQRCEAFLRTLGLWEGGAT